MSIKLLEQRALTTFEAIFELPPERQFFAPGRVNLIGEHTDYNDGFVMPCAINYGTLIACSLRPDRRVCLTACDFGGETAEFEISDSIPPALDNHWSNYIRGVFQEFSLLGCHLNGLNMSIAGDVPQGAGLSSSASLEVAVATTLNDVFGAGLSVTEIALLAQRAENNYVGCNCGIMDQLISASGQHGSAQLIDCRSLEHQPVTIPSQLELLVINSNVKRGLVDSEYNDRRAQCEAVAQHFNVKALRDISLEQLNAAKNDLDDLLFRRARHIISENDRTVEAAIACKTNNVAKLSNLMRESHLSMRDDFEITVTEIDWLVDSIHEIIGSTGGTRMTGGGFGGCVIALLPHAVLSDVTDMISREYPKISGIKASTYLCSPSAGASEVSS